MPLIAEAPKPVIRLSVAGRQTSRIVFFGTPMFAVPALRALHKSGWPIAVVVTAMDKPIGRRMLLTPSPVKSVAQELDIPVITPATLKDDGFLAQLSSLKPILGVVAAYGKIIPKSILNIFPKGILNIHPSLLPAYRGPSPIQAAILDGLKETGVSLMVLDEEMDHGPTLAQQKWAIPSGADYPFCESELSRLGANLLIDILPGYLAGSVEPMPQNHAKATSSYKFTREDGRIDWTAPASVVHNKIRALAANPGTWTTWNNRILNIFYAHPTSLTSDLKPSAKPGTIFLHSEELAVACGQGALAIETLQLQGSTRQSAKDFLNGHSAFVDSRLT